MHDGIALVQFDVSLLEVGDGADIAAVEAKWPLRQERIPPQSQEQVSPAEADGLGGDAQAAIASATGKLADHARRSLTVWVVVGDGQAVGGCLALSIREVNRVVLLVDIDVHQQRIRYRETSSSLGVDSWAGG